MKFLIKMQKHLLKCSIVSVEYFKTSYSFHNIWETPLMNHKKMPLFFKHNINTGRYESKICPLGNINACIGSMGIHEDLFLRKTSLRKDLKILIYLYFYHIVLSFNESVPLFILFQYSFIV